MNNCGPSIESSALVDVPAAERSVASLLSALGANLDDEALQQTPRRVVAAYRELLVPQDFEATTFPNSEGYDELVLVRAIPFRSLCAHHLLPFTGLAHVAYLPGDRILGLSKLARVVEFCSRGFQVQERVTWQIAEWLEKNVEPVGVGVVIDAQHSCMAVRGVRAVGSWTTTTAMRGVLRQDPERRREFLSAIEADRSRAVGVAC
ncbi:GTP cyclohydrolase I [Planosporangium thailandense]|uniref:GTP cyclohydrolase 1 n=1 Tax=Planosporangium thailandense TaxID=765197 RepID=A0ABX0Y4R9_9ACTN|nr:GTP cyclohydrolase I [Planosporangium thailandense]NJC73091.1 GTP cyclohydrolase I [Planosporangium thailandense]